MMKWRTGKYAFRRRFLWGGIGVALSDDRLFSTRYTEKVCRATLLNKFACRKPEQAANPVVFSRSINAVCK